jgi:hypothetical protein
MPLCKGQEEKGEKERREREREKERNTLIRSAKGNGSSIKNLGD